METSTLQDNIFRFVAKLTYNLSRGLSILVTIMIVERLPLARTNTAERVGGLSFILVVGLSVGTWFACKVCNNRCMNSF